MVVLNAVSKAIRKHYDIVYHLTEYEEHSAFKNSNAQAMSYVGITDENDNLTWGVGTDEDIIKASIHALVNAVNKKVLFRSRHLEHKINNYLKFKINYKEF